KVIPGAKRNVFKQEADSIKVYLTAPPVDGKANKALIAFLAQHFSVRKAQVVITKGLQTRNKTISIEKL
ncbi:MAG: DUF167 domain-containing protein, partial [Candidatus Omnitrophica bacterium]|nr:DUF167 domain-containing protein [Candidatus Omnitrophota bacterium]